MQDAQQSDRFWSCAWAILSTLFGSASANVSGATVCVQEAGRWEHDSYQLRRPATAATPADLCKLHVVATLGHQAELLDRCSDAPASWQQGGLTGPLLPPQLEAAAAAAYADTQRGLHAAQAADGRHAARLAAAQGAVEWAIGVRSAHTGPPPPLETLHVRPPASTAASSQRMCSDVLHRSDAHSAVHFMTSTGDIMAAAVTPQKATLPLFGISASCSCPLLKGSSTVQAGLADFVDVWATSPSGQPVAVVLLTPLHTQPLAPAALQGWMSAVVSALRTALPVAVVPTDAPAESMQRCLSEQLCHR